MSPTPETAVALLPASGVDIFADIDFNRMFSAGEILGDVGKEVENWSMNHTGLLIKIGLAAPAAFTLLSMLSTGVVEAGVGTQSETSFHFPVELGDGALAGFMEKCINDPVDMTGGMAAIGGVIGTLRLLPQLPGAWGQLTRTPEGQAANYTAALTRLGGLFYSNTLQEGLQWARLPLFVSATYWFNELSMFAPAEVAPMFKATALVMAGVTFVSALEALDPFH